MKITINRIIKLVGEIENSTYGNTLPQMVEFERSEARNLLRESIMKKLGYQYRWTGVNRGKWEPIPTQSQLSGSGEKK